MSRRYRIRDKVTGLYLVAQINEYWVPQPNGPSTLVVPLPEWERIPEACQTFSRKDAQTQLFLLAVHSTHRTRHAEATQSLKMKDRQ
jgi:hypothetical protein